MGVKNRDLDWENRVLCSDESCIGVIGPDGLCKECGLAYEGELPAASDIRSPVKTMDTAPAPVEAAESDEALVGDVDDEWAQRTLCRDESCIGVIGPDGNCKECGKPLHE